MSDSWTIVADLFLRPEAARHYGESVTIAEHMLQAAALAADAGAADHLVAAALLHDVGHIVDPARGPDDRDRKHAELGHLALTELFAPAVTEPVRLHVAAKRYLVATDPSYAERLSPASVHTLHLQGGPMNSTEQLAFEREPAADEALAVRRWDEEAKVPGRAVPPLERYRSIIERTSRSQPQPGTSS